MSSWHIKPQAVLRVTLALITTAFPLLAIAVGGADLLTWIRIGRDNQYYVDHWYLWDAGWWLLVGMIGVLPTVWVVCQPQARLRWLWLPVLVSLFMILYPGMIKYAVIASPEPHEHARHEVRHQLSELYVELKHATEQGRPWRCVSGPTTMLSPYSRAGERLAYQQVCVAADRPTESLLASSAPGTIYIVTSSSEKIVSLMATVLSQNVGDTVSWLGERTGKPVRLTFSLLEYP